MVKISRLLQNIGFFCRIQSLSYGTFAKEREMQTLRPTCASSGEVAMITRLLQNIGFFCRICLFYRALLQKRERCRHHDRLVYRYNFSFSLFFLHVFSSRRQRTLSWESRLYIGSAGVCGTEWRTPKRGLRRNLDMWPWHFFVSLQIRWISWTRSSRPSFLLFFYFCVKSEAADTCHWVFWIYHSEL